MTVTRSAEASAERDWLTVGAQVAVLSTDHRKHADGPVYATVARIGKRDVVLDDGQRFNSTRLTRDDGGGRWSSRTFHLLPATHPVVEEAAARRRYQDAVQNAKSTADRWLYGRDGTQPADLILALAALTGVESEIQAVFARQSTPAAGGDRDE